TTSNNIANVNTEGYSRQVIDFNSRAPEFIGGNWVGTGTFVSNVKRVFDGLAVNDLRTNLANYNSLNAYLDQASRVDEYVANLSTGLSPDIQRFFDAVQASADDPSSIASRSSIFTQSDLLINRFKLLSEQLDTQQRNINTELGGIATEISAIGNAIADINEDIVQALGQGSSQSKPNGLLDTRDQLINDLSKLIQVSTVQQGDGSINVFIGNGQGLVIGYDSYQLSARLDPADAESFRLELAIGGNNIPITKELVGGKLGGLISYRNEILVPTKNKLGLIALGVADSINKQHQIGMNLNGELGGLFFKDINASLNQFSRVVANTDNTGSAQLSMTIDDVSAVSADNYELSYSSGTNTFTVTNLTTGTIEDTFVNLGIPSTYTNANLGFTVNLTNGALSDGDRFALTPARNAISLLEREITDASQLALAFPVNATSSISNAGTIEIRSVDVTDTSTSAFSISGSLNPPLRIEFTSATSYDVIDANTNAAVVSGVTYTPNESNDLLAQAGLNLGYEINVSGSAATGDVINLEYNTAGFGDNRNALALANIQLEKVLDNGNTTLQEAYGLIISEVGAKTNEAKVSQQASLSLVRQTESRIQEESGVNLDEEAAKLIKYQQSYQAAAQLISTANLIFDTLIASVR
ncbi:MAG: flagellar hook-associated protein FlgK, partial [Gammaproteobacteria bacterium]|nr:flagellar hook-associated protein FlgK [Gammaproteobacteria bacterium]NNJ72436.1 flagellar hook-associated protein FlgK [Enterobacterales bacterium]